MFSVLYITPIGCDGEAGEGLAAGSHGVFLYFVRGIKSEGAILVLTAGLRGIAERGCARLQLCVLASDLVKKARTTCKFQRVFMKFLNLLDRLKNTATCVYIIGTRPVLSNEQSFSTFDQRVGWCKEEEKGR